jgi:tRNA A37 threonylcarbamoyladenosine dehydratase
MTGSIMLYFSVIDFEELSVSSTNRQITAIFALVFFAPILLMTSLENAEDVYFEVREVKEEDEG